MKIHDLLIVRIKINFCKLQLINFSFSGTSLPKPSFQKVEEKKEGRENFQAVI